MTFPLSIDTRCITRQTSIHIMSVLGNPICESCHRQEIPIHHLEALYLKVFLP